MQFRFSSYRPVAIAAVAFLLVLGAGVAWAADFEEKLARVDAALRKNPGRADRTALESCLRQRNFAVKLYGVNEVARAERSLRYCFHALRVPENPPPPEKKTGPSIEEIQARAAREVERALNLTPDIERGLEIYRGCAECHMPEGWGLSSGLVPQLAGQHRTVVIKQLADIRAGNRDTVVMAPYATVEVIGGTQAVADVAAYIDSLEITAAGGKGPGDELELGERLYREDCLRCHGESGEGNLDAFIPRIQSQHYRYLVRQFEWIRDGKRRNSNPEKQMQIEHFDERQMRAVLDYVSRLEPAPELQAPPGWKNPDFAE